eukprot:COSAG04_NODE_21_length_38435_cov_79.510382_19_plen_111_part_00
MPKSFYKITIWSKIWGVLQKKNFLRHRVPRQITLILKLRSIWPKASWRCWRTKPPPVENHWRLVIPDEVSRRAIMDEFHTVFQSHPSAGAMYRLMRQRVWWPSMARDCTL